MLGDMTRQDGDQDEEVKDLHSEFLLNCRYNEIDEINGILSSLQKLSISARDFILNFNASALFYSCANGHDKILEILLSFLTPADINVANEEGNTPIHWASINGHLEVVKILLRNGASARSRNKAGLSSISLAESREHLEVVQILLSSFDPEDEESGDEEESRADKTYSTRDQEYQRTEMVGGEDEGEDFQMK